MRDYTKYVGKFSHAMIETLITNEKYRNKRGWENLSNEHILKRIKEETAEIETALINQAPTRDIIKECTDVANFCMMLADNLERRDEGDKK